MSSQTATAVPPSGAEVPVEPEAPRVSSARAYWRLAFFLLFLAALYVPGLTLKPDEVAYRLPKFNRFMALALYALSVDLIWGYTGLLSLGQGLYFGIGGYLVGYSLILQKAALDAEVPRYDFGPEMELPPFMFQNRLTAVPAWIAPLIRIWWALGLAVLIPMVLAALFGFVVFQRRIKGVYFSLITQAVVLAMFHLVTNQMPYTGGEGGLYNLAYMEVLGIELKGETPAVAVKGWNLSMYLLITTVVVFFGLVCYVLMHSKLGKILTAIRDNEFRVMALGYNTAMYKTFVFTLAGFMAGLAGALFVAANRTAGPTFFSISESIEVVIFVAVGGRGTLAGPILGALLVSEGKDLINEKFRDLWPIVLGGLFMSVVLFLPEGILGGIPRFFRFLRIWFYRRPGLARSWNAVRVGVGLMYWGIVLIMVAVALRVIVGYTATPPRGVDPATLPLFDPGVMGQILYWMIMAGSLMTIAGQCACWVAPRETPGRKLAPASVVAVGLFALIGIFTVSAPLSEFQRILALRGFGEIGTLLLLFLGLAVTLSYLLFALFLRGVAVFYQNVTLARSARNYIILFCAFLACNVFLNSMGDAARSHPVGSKVLFLFGLAHVGMMLVLPVWFLRLLYQTHESINRPLTSF